MIPLVVDQLRALIEAAPDILRVVSGYTERWFNVEVSVDTLSTQLTDRDSDLAGFATNIAGNVFGFASSLLGTIFKLLTIALFTFYLTADGPRFRRTICSYVPPAARTPCCGHGRSRSRRPAPTSTPGCCSRSSRASRRSSC